MLFSYRLHKTRAIRSAIGGSDERCNRFWKIAYKLQNVFRASSNRRGQCNMKYPERFIVHRYK